MFADLKPYPEYEESSPGVLAIPPHWNRRRVKAACRFRYGDALPAESRIDGEVDVMGSNGRIGSHSHANTSGRSIVIGRKGSFGKVALCLEPVFVMDTAYHVDESSTTENIFWLAMALSWLRLDAVSRDSAIPGLDRTEAEARILPVPPLVEQAAIVRYLAHANARIDRAIAAKRRLIALLTEQKQAIIGQAVTLGLDQEVPLVDSGIPWVGPVPRHWRIHRAKHFFADVDARSVTGTEELLSVSHLTGVTPRRLKSVSMFKAASYVGHKMCERGDLVVNTMWAWMGALGVAAEAGIVSPAYNVYRSSREDVDPDFAGLLFKTPAYVAYFRSQSTGVQPSRLRFYPDQLGSTPIALPPVGEQVEIVTEVAARTVDADVAIAAARREVALLREFRTRLIADVVTGQLDVREIAAGLPDLDPAELVGDVGADVEDDLDTEAAEFLEDVET